MLWSKGFDLKNAGGTPTAARTFYEPNAWYPKAEGAEGVHGAEQIFTVQYLIFFLGNYRNVASRLGRNFV